MIILKYSQNYLTKRKKFLKNNPPRAEKVIKRLKLFVHNPNHPSLRIEKLKGNDVWTIRVDKGNRIFFTWETIRIALLLDIGKHDKYRTY
ncbi:MAG TPA: plasmid stabilization protein [Patescibacteria group bacterium]|nr:plasmid stabilization protein [Patescibacteria group bacterium]